MITKIGETVLQEHQKRVVDRLYQPEQKGIIAYHSMGSGKTLTALEALRRAQGNKLVITPASLVNNVYKESEKHGIPLENTKVMSYEAATRHADELLENPYDLLVFDEAHKLRNDGTSRVSKLKKLIGNSNKTLMLTGTAGYNHPADMGMLINLIDETKPFPKSHKEFEAVYIDPQTQGLRRTKELGELLRKYIDVYETPRSTTDFPKVYTKTIEVPMSDKQTKVYRFAEETLPVHLRKAVRENLPLSLQDSIALNTFATGMRQASDSPVHHDVTANPHDSPKLMTAVNNLVNASKKPNFRGVVYSNYVDAGLNPYAKLLEEKGIHPLVFTGKLSASQKKDLINEYNSDTVDPKVLLVSSSGGEGLDLKGTRLMQILEPHFNQAKIDQVKARGARYKSHAHLPEKDRNLTIEEYQSVMPLTFLNRMGITRPDGTIDKYLQQAATRKQRLIDEMKYLSS